ncbi:hypothetical protein ACEWY4_019379 [Coilia grayii]|uniref:Centrosomal protein of 192 kDa n=1 Tax=Coilia grayii TaxID=363190 RepID=A0ABD1J9J8_9TELE
MEGMRDIVDESFPCLSDQSSLGDFTLSPTLGTPVAVSTVAKIRAAVDNRRADAQASSLEIQDGPRENFSLEERPRFQLSFKDDLGDAEDFFADRCLSDMLVKVSLEESTSKPKTSATALSAGPLNFSQNDIGLKWEEPDLDTASTLQVDESSFHLQNLRATEDEPGTSVEQENHKEASAVSDASFKPADSASDEDAEGASLDLKYLCQSFNEEEEPGSWNHFPDDLDFHQGGDGKCSDEEEEAPSWNHCPEDMDFLQGGAGKHSVVYQNEEGQWVTDLAYYSSFEKELENHPSKEVSSLFQKEEFFSGSKAMDKITEDQKVFEEEHRFIQEEKIEANTSLGLGDSSWKLPASSHILMRASQLSSELARGSQSYLRLSLGEFFQQRSEALGCLGSEEDEVKRPSFGYIITSPERREPLPLIRPSDFSSRESPNCSDTVHLSDADEPMSAVEDLDKTLEDQIDRTLTSTEVQLAPTDKQDVKALNHTVVLEKDCDTKESAVWEADASEAASNVELSISTIASAIANASLSSDPAQLAAMIIQLSQRSGCKGEQMAKGTRNASLSPDQNCTAAAAVTDTAGDVGVSDMEKYLQRVELSGSDSEMYGSQSCVDILGVTDVPQDVSHHPTAGPTFTNDLESGARHSAEIEKLSHEHNKMFSSSRTLSKPSVGTSDGNLTAVCQKFLKPASPRNCSLPKSEESSHNSELMPNLEPVSAHKQVDTDTCTNRCEGDAYVKLRNTPAWGTQESLKDTRSPPEQTTPPVHAQSFRPSTFPLTHSSPSQTSLRTREGVLSPVPSEDLAKTCLVETPSPESHNSNLSLSRLTYLSINDGHSTPDHKKNLTMELSTTIIRASPTPEEEKVTPGKVLEDIPEEHSGNSADPLTSASVNHRQVYSLGQLSQNGPNFSQRTTDFKLDNMPLKHCSELHQCGYAGDGGYMSNLNIQTQPGVITDAAFQPGVIPDAAFLRPPYSQQWHGALGPAVQCAHPPPAYTTPDPCYAPPPMTTYGSHAPSCADHPRPVPAPHLAEFLGGGCGSVRPPLPGLSSCHFSSAHQCCRKPYVQQNAPQWLSTDFTDLGVVVPDELTFPSPCCVGIASQTALSIFNPTDRWLQVSISTSTLSIDGQQVDILPYQWLVVKNKTVVCPKSTEEQKVLFVPPRPGVYRCTLNVLSWPASAEPEALTPATGCSKHIFFSGVAENPAIEVDIGKSGCLHFGDLPSGSSKTLPLRLINRSHAVVPIRLVLSANAAASRCFTFSKSSVPDGAALPTDHRPFPSVVNYVLNASSRDRPEVFMIWVHFHAPQKYISTTGELGPADEFTAHIDIEVDRPGPSCVIQSVGLKARSGTARVHAPRHLQTVTLCAPFGQSAQQTLPLKNAGNVDVQLRLKCSASFSVKPSELMLCVGEEQGIVVSFTAKEKQKCDESVLTILVLPSGPQYEVLLKGEVQLEAKTQPVPPSAVSQCQVPPILSNKQFIAWGGVTIGMAMQQKLVLRNNSPSVAQQLRLQVRGQDQDCFQLQSSFGPEERLSHLRELSIRPKEDVTVHLLYTPSRVACMLAKLDIKQSSLRSSQPGIKFTIPLSGYGGTSNIILEDLEKYSEGYIATMSGVRVGSISKLCLCVRNTGSRAAYVRAVVYADPQKSQLAERTVFSLAPSQFVLKERSKEVITVLLKTTAREQALCQSKPSVLATVCLFCGDEISRQQYKRFQRSKPVPGQRVLSDSSLLKNVCFDEVFLGEDDVNEVCDLPQRPSDGQMFLSSMKKVTLTLLGTSDSADPESHLGYQHTSLCQGAHSDGGLEASDSQASHVSLDVLPVKGPPLEVKESSQVAVDQRSGSWSIKPEQVVLRAPVIGGDTDTCQVQLVNHLGCELSFELSWPAHCLVITPQNGVIEPESHVSIHISPTPCLVSKPLQLPWHGIVYVLCDGQQKFVKVQIQQDLAKDVGVSAVSEKLLLPVLPQAETAALSSAKTQPRAGIVSQIEIVNSNLVFPVTACGGSSECPLKVENRGEEVRWYLSSLAPPYVKGVDDTGDVFRANYSAFRCPKVFGVLETQTNMQVIKEHLSHPCSVF